MTDEERPLRPATPDEIENALSFALRFNGRKRVHNADSFMADIATERLRQHLELSGFVVMKKPPRPAHGTHEPHVPPKE